MLTDYHMHLVDDDAPYTDESFTVAHMQRYVDTAARRGVAEIGFTDHVYRFTAARDWLDEPLWQNDGVNDLGRYFRAVKSAQEAGLPVKVGLEVDYLAGQDEQIAGVVNGWAWDYVLGSVHWIDGYAVDWDAKSIWDQMAVDDVWRRYADELCAAAATGLYDSMAHPDVVKGFGWRPDPPPRALYEQIADAFQAAGVCAEVSTAGLQTPLEEVYPAPELLRLLRERNVPVTLASDAHDPGEVGRDFDRSVAALHDAGYRTITVFQRHDRRQVALDE
jgi:histidinol-phosphatase (PHP family)